MSPGVKKWVWFALKLLVSAGIIYLIFNKIWQRQDADKLLLHLSELRYGWVLGSALALCTAIACSLLRWERLLVGQGIHAPWKHLITTFMIGRFFGAVTPGGLGLGGYRIYDISKHTGKTARAVASIGIEMVLGNLAVGIVALVSCLFGRRYVGDSGLAMLALVFGGLISVTFTILWKPRLVRSLSERLPPAFRQRLRNMVDAVCAYDGEGALLGQSTLLAVGTHTFNGLLYVSAAHALGVDLPVTELFFVSVLQNVAAHVPVSINGVGLREAAALGLYTIVGVPPELAVLIPIVGFSVEMAISSLGGVVLLLRKADYAPVIRVEQAEREQINSELIEHVPEAEWPRVGRGLALGASAGVFAGLFVGLGEALAIVVTGHGRAEPDVWAYAALSYGLCVGLLGVISGGLLAFTGRLMARRAIAEPDALGHMTGSAAAFFGAVIGAFRVQRDVFHEELVWKSVSGLTVIVCVLGGAAVVYGLFFFGMRALSSSKGGARFAGPASAIGVLVLTCGLTAALARSHVDEVAAKPSAPAPSGAGNVLFVVVDTLRADHLTSYGYTAGKTPSLDAFARDAVRFEHAYANASWTRPSFATLMTGRYASSHGVMSKAASLPDEALTVAEAFRAGGYTTQGVVTNYNVAPFFNFQQGFDTYHYLAPNFLFGASDTAAKLSLLQVIRRVDEGARAALKRTEPGSAYQDAAVVNEEVLRLLDARRTDAPFFMFAAYMDPHDPYYEHPYNGVGYSRAAHVKPKPEEAERLRTLYDGEITYWDEHFGKLVAALKQRKLYDELTIVVTADHGEEFMEHGGFWHGTTLYDEQLHVPLFVKLPRGERAGSSVSHWVESVDVMPTLLAQQQLTVPAEVQGVDLFRGKDQTFAEESHDGNVLRALRTRDQGTALKLILANPQNPRGLKERELYAIEADPREQKDLAAESAPALARTGEELEAVNKQARTGALKAREVDVSMDKTAEERLKALGYAGEH
jgi:arylsulfatase A-like enzyme/uncharacterized membrane protein YbhN (UPF0104 family)